jgi:hypothetical protein
MLILFGFGYRTVRDHGPTVFQRCPNCHNEVWFRLLTIRRWFTLFFIPIFPYSSQHLFLCPTCSRGADLSGADLARALQLNALAEQYAGSLIGADAYMARVAELTGQAPPGLASPPGQYQTAEQVLGGAPSDPGALVPPPPRAAPAPPPVAAFHTPSRSQRTTLIRVAIGVVILIVVIVLIVLANSNNNNAVNNFST